MEGLRKVVRSLMLFAYVALCLVSGPGLAESAREVIGPGDTVRITAYRYPDLTTEARLSEEGKLNVPLVGEMSLKGLTPEQAARRIADRLRSGEYITDPQITVTVLQARSRTVSVMGFVRNPGRYVLDGMTAKVSDVIAMAGGLEANGSQKVIVQPNGDKRGKPVTVDLGSVIEGDSSKNVDVRGGDSVFVPRAPVVYVHGEVTRGGAYRLEPDMTVMQAISLAGGVTPRGSQNRVQLRRRAADGKWKESTAKLTDTVDADDVIYVRESLF